MIYTSFYSKAKNFDPTQVAFVQTSNSVPKGFPKTFELPEVYPGWDLVNDWKQGRITWAQYTMRYLEKLKSVDVYEVREFLQDLSNSYRDIMLLCWEGPNTHCHRYILASWLNMGIQEY